jgi:hypothetical protein
MNPASAVTVTQLLRAWSSGDQTARERLIPLVYVEETAETLQISQGAVNYEVDAANAWLYHELSEGHRDEA